jgi:poly [ADP-ribose] polymerase
MATFELTKVEQERLDEIIQAVKVLHGDKIGYSITYCFSTGSGIGDGVYFANKSQKSLGYSSLSGSHWTRGNSSVGFLALFDVHLGNEKHIHKHDSSCYKLNYTNIQNDGFDSVYAHGGADLRNDEFIIYNPVQCTISHLIQMES